MVEGGAIQVVLEGVSSQFAAEPAFGVREAKPGVGGPTVGPSFEDVECDRGGETLYDAKGVVHLLL